MAQAAHAHMPSEGGGHGHGQGGHGPHHPASYYVKIWAILLGLLVVSIMGPMLGVKILTIITAFGIAIVKATMVAAFFMHLNIEKKYVWYMLFTMLAFVALFFFAVAPDVLRPQGQNWINAADHDYMGKHVPGYDAEEKAEEKAAEKPPKSWILD